MGPKILMNSLEQDTNELGVQFVARVPRSSTEFDTRLIFGKHVDMSSWEFYTLDGLDQVLVL